VDLGSESGSKGKENKVKKKYALYFKISSSSGIMNLKKPYLKVDFEELRMFARVVDPD
jgi:hypothetical protein